MKHYTRQAQNTGETRTILGRRIAYDTWEPADERGELALPFDAALSKWGSRIKRAHTHKATNALVQGSSADLMKAALVQAYQSGVFDVTGLPKLVVHDELDVAVRDHSKATEGAIRELRHVMETAIPFSVPILVEGERGSSWGTLTKEG